MKTGLVAVLLLTGLVGCGKQPAPKPAVAVPLGRQWSDAVVDDDPYRGFIKTWHMQMASNISLDVEVKYEPWLDVDCAQYCSFIYTMQQGDNPDKWVIFNCDAVAEKIINTSLVPLVERDCKILHDEAVQYWKDNPDPIEFTDSKGRVWTRGIN